MSDRDQVPPLPADQMPRPPESLLDAINWLMGLGDSFEPSPDAFRHRGKVPPYWFRGEFAKRAGLTYDGEKGRYSLPATPPAPVVVSEPTEAMVNADLAAPLCDKCEGMDIYDRSPESCRDCARIRLRAALDAQRGQ